VSPCRHDKGHNRNWSAPGEIRGLRCADTAFQQTPLFESAGRVHGEALDDHSCFVAPSKRFELSGSSCVQMDCSRHPRRRDGHGDGSSLIGAVGEHNPMHDRRFPGTLRALHHSDPMGLHVDNMARPARSVHPGGACGVLHRIAQPPPLRGLSGAVNYLWWVCLGGREPAKTGVVVSLRLPGAGPFDLPPIAPGSFACLRKRNSLRSAMRVTCPRGRLFAFDFDWNRRGESRQAVVRRGRGHI
jgi:hypothetical protein